MSPDSDRPTSSPKTGASEPLSVCIVAFNEEHNIRDCLKSVAWADEIVVVDSLSTDATPQICRELNVRLIQRPWPGYVAQKNFALEQARHEWVLCLDADERVSAKLREEIEEVLRAVGAGRADCVAYDMPRRVFYLGRWIRHGGWYPGRKLRLAKRSSARWGGTDPHDHLYANGKTSHLRGDLLHYTYRDLSDHLRRINKFTTTAAEEMMKQGVGMPLFHMLTRPQGRFLRMYVLRLGFLDGVPGLVVAALSACYVFLKYAKLWEMRRRRPEGPS